MHIRAAFIIDLEADDFRHAAELLMRMQDREKGFKAEFGENNVLMTFEPARTVTKKKGVTKLPKSVTRKLDVEDDI